jgi:hypothetical protein
MTTAIVPYQDIERMGVAIAKSGLFGMKTPEQAIALMLIAQAEGMHPAIAARDYHVIQGRPTLKADAMLARFQAQGGKVQWHEYTDTKVSGTFSHPQGGTVKIEWTIQQAQKIGLANKDVWKHYPRQMLRARVVSEGIRTVYPGVSVGIYTPEEVADFEPVKPANTDPPVIEGEVQRVPDPDVVPVGKYKGKPWAELSVDQLDWYADPANKCSPPLADGAKTELAKRAAAEPRNVGSDRQDTRETLEELAADRPFE